MLSFAGSLAGCGGSCRGPVELCILRHLRPVGSTRTTRAGLEVSCTFATVSYLLLLSLAS